MLFTWNGGTTLAKKFYLAEVILKGSKDEGSLSMTIPVSGVASCSFLKVYGLEGPSQLPLHRKSSFI